MRGCGPAHLRDIGPWICTTSMLQGGYAVKVEQMKLSALRPYPGNPRVNDGAVDGVAASIRQFGWRVPIVVDPDLVIICGHTRYKAAQKLGLEEVPVHVAK